MKPFKSLSNVRLLLFASLFLASCGEQTELEQPGVTHGETVVVTKELRFDVLPMQTVGSPATRSASDKPEQGAALGITYGDNAATRGTTDMTSDESAIHSAYILQFDGTAPTSVLKTVKSITAEELNGTASITCDFQMTDGVKNRVYVVANLTQNQIDAIDANAITPVTLADFEKPIDFAPGETLPETGLPMSSMQDIGVGDVFDVFRLKSILAKLKFTCKTEGATLLLKGVPSGYSFYTQAQPGDAAVRLNGMTYNNAGVALTSGTAYYVPENLSGRVQLSSPLVRCSLFAPGSSMLVVISSANSTYNIYLGDGSASDFNFSGGCAYNINATLYGVSDLDWRVGTPPSAVALDGSGTANCYIPTNADKWYSFNGTVMGNGAITSAHTAGVIPGDANFEAIIPSKLNPAKAEVLWESVNSVTAPAKGAIVNNAVYVAKGRVLFKSGSTAGNAVIAAKDASNNIIWSWHIWRTEGELAGIALAEIANNDKSFVAPALKLMDRNLGALAVTTTESTDSSVGLYYQWGRKDPFPGAAVLDTISSGFAKATNVDFAADQKKNTSSVAGSIASPTTFYAGGDWCITRNDNLWGCPLTEIVTIKGSKFNKNAGSKSIYDPCPVGWRVAPDYAFAKATKPAVFTMGYNFDGSLTTSGTSLFLPASGSRNYDGMLANIGRNGYYWTSTPNIDYPGNVSRLNFGETYVYTAFSYGRSYGSTIRCVQ